MEERYCQSCAMPLGASDEMLGTNADGSANSDYCKYCFADGTFTQDVAMDEMIDICVPIMASANTGMSEDEARKRMGEFFPTLKRWRKN